MPKRICDVDGKEENIEGGKTCENGHFICKKHAYTSGLLGPSKRKVCPICKKPLR
jgi:hypothetical protein